MTSPSTQKANMIGPTTCCNDTKKKRFNDDNTRIPHSITFMILESYSERLPSNAAHKVETRTQSWGGLPRGNMGSDYHRGLGVKGRGGGVQGLRSCIKP